MLTVRGEQQPEIYSGLQEERVYLPEGGGIQEIRREELPVPVLSFAEKIEEGGRLYSQNCAACHQPEGQGIAGAFPPLAGSDYLLADSQRAIGVIVNGLSGPIVVNGETYNGVMPGVLLSDSDIANILTFVLNSFGNEDGEIFAEDVARVRAQH